MKPIEPGCLALVTGTNFWPQNVGAVVSVVRRCNEADDNALPQSWVVEGMPSGAIYCQHRHLLRIDGGEDEGVTTEQESEVSA